MIAEKEPAGTSTGVAALLRETRNKLGRDIAVAATTLRIRQPYLEAIEDGRFEDLPGSTYAVGFVRAYAEYLGLDGAEIVRRFKQETDIGGRAELVFPSATSGGGIPTSALLILALVGAGIAYGVWVWLQDRNGEVAEAVPPLPERLAALIHKPVDAPADTPAATTQALQQAPAEQSAAAVAAGAATPPPIAANTQPESAAPTQPPAATETAPPPAPVQAQPEPAPAPAASTEPAKPAKVAKAKKAEAPPPAASTPAPEAAASQGDNPAAAAAPTENSAAPAATPDAPKKVVWKPSKRIKITANADCWIKIRDANGQMVLSRLLHAGDTFTPPGNAGLVMTVGNAAALNMVVDGKERPPLGAEGVVKHVALDPDKADADAPAETPPSNQ